MDIARAADWIAIAIIPCIMFGLWGGAVAAKMRSRGKRTALQTVSALMMILPPLIGWTMKNYSVMLLFWHSFITLALSGYIFFHFAHDFVKTYRAPQKSTGRASDRRRKGKLIQSVTSALVFLPIVLLTGWSFAGDYPLPSRAADGTAGKDEYHRSGKGPGSYTLLIDGKSYGITLDLLATVQEGARIHAEIGVGSDQILSIKPL